MEEAKINKKSGGCTESFEYCVKRIVFCFWMSVISTNQCWENPVTCRSKTLQRQVSHHGQLLFVVFGWGVDRHKTKWTLGLSLCSDLDLNPHWTFVDPLNWTQWKSGSIQHIFLRRNMTSMQLLFVALKLHIVEGYICAKGSVVMLCY